MKKKVITTALVAIQLASFSAYADSGNTSSSNWNNVASNLEKASKKCNEIVNSGNGDNGGNDNNGDIDIDNAVVKYSNLSYTLNDHINKELQDGTNYINGSIKNRNNNLLTTLMLQNNLKSFIEAGKDDLAYYLDPDNFVNNKKDLYQYLTNDQYRDISVQKLNDYLNKKAGSVFKNKGQAFIDAAKKYNIDPVYFVAHSMWETGYGTSTLAKGQILTSYQGKKLDKPVTVYNFFGIGAVDGSANLSGAEAAYKNGWTNVESTLNGSANWLANGYMHSKYGQNTLFKMRWNYDVTWHQYATDVNWAKGISEIMSQLSDLYNSDVTLNMDIPNYK